MLDDRQGRESPFLSVQESSPCGCPWHARVFRTRVGTLYFPVLGGNGCYALRPADVDPFRCPFSLARRLLDRSGGVASAGRILLASPGARK